MKKWLSLLLMFMFLLPLSAWGEELIEPCFPEDHFFFAEMNRSSCWVFTHDITVYVVFAETPSSAWDQEAMDAAKAALEDAFSYLEQNAALYETSLSLTPSYHLAPGLSAVNMEEREAWVDDALEKAGLPKRGGEEDGSIYDLERPILLLLNETGRNFSVANGDYWFGEYIFLYDGFTQSSVVHELMHLFGARDYYYPDAYQQAAERLFPDSVMLAYGSSAIDSLTAYCIGWTDTLDDAAMAFLEETAHIDEETFNEALEQSTFTGYDTREYEDYTYAGEWVMGERAGQGVLEWKSGTRYVGQFERDKRQGQGMLSYDSGEIFKGAFEDNQRQGYGVMVWNDLGLYAGNWEDDTATGKATRILNDGSIHSGYMEDFTLHGAGIQIWPDGSVYRGNFINGKRTGRGSLIWADGSLYTGEFVDGTINGYGIYINAEGEIFEGNWVNGQLQAPDAEEE